MKLKTETFAKKYPLTTKAVGRNVDKLISSIFASPKNFELLENFFEWGFVRPTQQVGRGRWSGLDDRRVSVETLLDIAGVKHIVCNDAPKGGKRGTIIVLADDWNSVNVNGEVRWHSVQEGINTRSISENVFKVFGISQEV